MENSIKVSVLTPIYNHNVEYVRKCLESLKAQTMQDIEFILIDNGATQESKDLIEEFEKSDNRFKVIHIEQNQGYGHAMNLGLKAAKGEYIGIVESDDWVEPEMYEKLYDIGNFYNIDIVKSYFLSFSETESHYGITFNQDVCNKTVKREDVPDYIFKYGSYWSAIYKKEMIEKYNIQFDIMKQPSAEDIMFIIKTYFCADTLYICTKCYYHYRNDNTNSSINKRGNRIYNTLKLYDKLDLFIQNTPTINTPENWALKNRREFLNIYLITKSYKIDNYLYFLILFSKRLKKYLKNNQVVLNQEELKIYKQIAFHPIIFYSKYKLKSIFSVCNSEDKKHKILTILGIKIKFKKKQNKIQIVTSNTGINKKEAYDIAYYFYDLQKCNIEAAAIHPDTFSKYKNLYKDKSIVVVGCGPSAKFYTYLKNCIHIGVNRAFLLDKVNLDYLFVQDWMDEKDMLLADKYKQDSCKKFYAVINEKRLMEVYHKIKRIPQYHIDYAKAQRYVLKPGTTYYDLPYDISINPVSDVGGTVFSVLQFALFTRTPLIYIVGCDCSVGHFHKEGKEGLGANLQDQVFWWKKFKEHVDTYYPHTEIISVNPVGLKGMFRDVYTQSYVNEHPELLDEDIEILQDSVLKGEETACV